MKNLHIKNFKSIADAELPLGRITLLTGLNGAGKSSVMQALLAIRQSYKSGELQRGLLNFSGELVDLGSAGEVLFEDASEDRIEFSFICDDRSESIRLAFDITEDRSIAIAVDAPENKLAIQRMLAYPTTSALLTGELPGADHLAFQYLHAERNGPRKSLPMSGRRRLELGTRGEYVLQALFEHQDSATLSGSDPRRIEGHGARLRDLVEAWLSEVSPGVRLDLTPLAQADLIVGGYTFGSEGSLRSRSFRATNVGFGLSYILPVLVALLATPPGGLVLIENPEAHLHPRGQTRIGELCARAAAAGVQVLVETHSDHLMDGVRIAVREGIIDPEDAIFHYFTRSGSKSSVETPSIDRSGKLSAWPAHFFDQHRRNTARLVKPAK
ncbi:DUF3696 domain-containing protein [Mesorhizobium sp. WSM3626]|uniref:DUF3696 domain-containing protein n=1 Tax=Mesorhizobium sp. WSM3626 TaxID=1040987 RepID=UPI0004879D2D|nr:DUF3696 domain-containing protein [Mesorhizobium sp. WSM3626]